MRKTVSIILALCLMLAPPAYAVSIMYTYQVPAQLQPDLTQIKSMNIDVIMNYNNNYPSTTGDTLPTTQAHIDYLDMLQAAGLKGAIDLRRWTQKASPDYAGLSVIVNALKNHPALYGWYMDDEPQLAEFPLTQRQLVYAAIKADDPNHPIWEVYPGYGVNWWPAGSGITASPYSNTTYDIFAIDNYPNHNLTAFQTEITGSYGNIAVGDRGKLLGTVQCYGANTSYLPTAAEIQGMASSYASAGWNTKGVAFWMWKWQADTVSPPPVGWTFLKDNSDRWSAVTTAAASYHEDLYGATISTINCRATMRATFR